MQRTALIVAGLLVFVGAVFVGQGLGLLRSSSFMTDDRRWAVIGASLVVAGIALAWAARRQRETG